MRQIIGGASEKINERTINQSIEKKRNKTEKGH